MHSAVKATATSKCSIEISYRFRRDMPSPLVALDAYETPPPSYSTAELLRIANEYREQP